MRSYSPTSRKRHIKAQLGPHVRGHNDPEGGNRRTVRVCSSSRPRATISLRLQREPLDRLGSSCRIAPPKNRSRSKDHLHSKLETFKRSQLLSWTWQEDASLQYLREEGNTISEIWVEFPWRIHKELQDRLAHLGRVAWPERERCFVRSRRTLGDTA